MNPAGSDPGARFARLRRFALVSRHPSALLLLAQLAGLLLFPLIEDTPRGNAAFGVFGLLVAVLAIRMVRHASGQAWTSLGIALPAIALNLLATVGGQTAMLPWAAALEALFYFHAAGSLMAYMLADQRATTDELFACGATFTLLAWGFTHAFVAYQALSPGAFSGAIDPGSPRKWSELLFLSFALLSSTGIGDVIPVTPPARAIASLEMFVGVMYLTLVVSRLVGLTLRKPG